jgi:hypothetical protein
LNLLHQRAPPEPQEQTISGERFQRREADLRPRIHLESQENEPVRSENRNRNRSGPDQNA